MTRSSSWVHSGQVHHEMCAGVVITAVDAFLFLMLERVGIRNLEALFGLLIGIMAASFGYMYADAGVSIADVSKGLLVCSPCPGHRPSKDLMPAG